MTGLKNTVGQDRVSWKTVKCGDIGNILAQG